MIKYRIQYNDGYYLFMGNSPHGKCPYITQEKDDKVLFSLAHVTEHIKELLTYIKENNLTGVNVHIIPVYIDD